MLDTDLMLNTPQNSGNVVITKVKKTASPNKQGVLKINSDVLNLL
jgi:hypothetical protein